MHLSEHLLPGGRESQSTSCASPDESAAAGPGSTQYAAGIIHANSMQGRIVSQRMISPLMPSAAAIRNSVGAGEVPDLSINPAEDPNTAEEENETKLKRKRALTAQAVKGLFTSDVSISWGLRHPLVLMSPYHRLLACPLVLQIDDVICEPP